jgi:hypothetical protein
MALPLDQAAAAALALLQRLQSGYRGIALDRDVEHVVDDLRTSLAAVGARLSTASPVHRARRLESLWAAGRQVQCTVPAETARATFADELAQLYSRVTAAGEHPHYTKADWRKAAEGGESDGGYWYWVAQHRFSMYRPANAELSLMAGDGAPIGTVRAGCWVLADLSPGEAQAALKLALLADDFVAAKVRMHGGEPGALEVSWSEDPARRLGALEGPVPDEDIETSDGVAFVSSIAFVPHRARAVASPQMR